MSFHGLVWTLYGFIWPVSFVSSKGTLRTSKVFHPSQGLYNQRRLEETRSSFSLWLHQRQQKQLVIILRRRGWKWLVATIGFTHSPGARRSKYQVPAVRWGYGSGLLWHSLSPLHVSLSVCYQETSTGRSFDFSFASINGEQVPKPISY